MESGEVMQLQVAKVTPKRNRSLTCNIIISIGKAACVEINQACLEGLGADQRKSRK